MRKNKKLIYQINIWVSVMFLIIALANGICIYMNNSRNYVKVIYRRTQPILYQLRDCLMEYEAFPWLFSYWQESYEIMDLPGETDERKDRIIKLLHENGVESATEIKTYQAESFSDEDKKDFAEYCYLEILPKFNNMEKYFLLSEVVCETLTDEGEIVVLFHGLSEGEKTPGSDFCDLGKHWSFDPEDQRVIREIYEKGEDLIYQEERTLDGNGEDYLLCYLPVKINGKTVCHISTAQGMRRVRGEIAKGARGIELINALFLLFGALILTYLIHSRVVSPLSHVTEYIGEYSKTKKSGKVVPKLISIRSENEVGRLADDFSDMIIEMERYTREKQRMAVENERISAELDLAAKIQASSIPDDFSMFSENEKVDLFASMTPAKTVGGDFYDFFFIDDDHLYMAIADVSGKGIPAAMFMMISRYILKSNAVSGRSPAKILEYANNAICVNNSEQMFVTVWVGILELSTGKLTASNAGHEQPVVYNPGGSFELFDDFHGFVIGFMDNQEYSDYEIILEPGSWLFLFTDGVVEATNASDEPFGKKRMLNALNRAKLSSPQMVLKEIRRSVDVFVKKAEQFDDLTMMCLEYKG